MRYTANIKLRIDPITALSTAAAVLTGADGQSLEAVFGVFGVADLVEKREL